MINAKQAYEAAANWAIGVGPRTDLAAGPLMGWLCDPSLPVNSHVAVDVT